MRKILSVLLTLCMVFTLLPKTALAAEDGYSYDAETKVLTITTNAETTGTTAAWKQVATIKDDVTSIIVADTVTSIGISCFADCPELTNVAIGKNVTSIQSNVFNRCPKLNTLTVAAESSTYKTENNVLFTKDGKTLVRYPEGLTDESYTIPSGVETIGGDAFYSSHITDISLPDSLKKIGDSGFYGCTNLSSLNLPSTVTEIGEAAFSDSAIASITIPEGVPSIGFNAFTRCSQLTSVTIGKGVTSINYNAFTLCPKLNVLTVDIENSAYKAENNVLFTKDGKTLVKYPEGLTAVSYTVPDGVETIGSRAFYLNPCLTTIRLADSVKQISREAFPSCKELTTISLGTSLNAIGDIAFADCKKLSSIDLPSTVTTIGASAFSSTAIASITIPTGVNSIGAGAFKYCQKLKTVIMESASAPTLGENAFSSSNSIIYTPAGATGYNAENKWPSSQVVEGRADLSGLSLSGITLSPTFSRATTSYTASVENSVDSTAVIPTIGLGTSVTVNGTAVISGSASSSINLNEGENTLTVVVANSAYPAEMQTYTITVTRKILTPNPKPNATFTATGADSGTLANVTNAMKYSVDGGTTWHSITAATMNITEVSPSKGIQIKQPGDDTTTTDSEVQTIAVTQATAPVGIDKTNEASALHNGTITGVSNLMEYKKSGEAIYNAISSSTVTGLDGGTYLVRTKATGTVLASPDVTLTITAFTKGTPTALDLNYSLAAVTFDGTAKPLSVTKNNVGIGDITVKYDGNTDIPTNAGTYTITVDIAGNAEYNGVMGLSLGNYTINKITYTGTTTVPASVLTSGQAGATVTLPTLPTGASYGAPTASGTIAMTDMSIAGTTLTYNAPASTAGQTGTMTIPVTGATNYNNYDIVVTVTAGQNSSGGGSGSSGGGGSSSSNNSSNDSNITVTAPPANKPNNPTAGNIKLDGKVDSNGNIAVNLSDKNVNDVYNKALADAKKKGNEANGITLVLNVDTGNKTASAVTVNLPKTVQDTIIAKKIINTVVVVDKPDIRIGMDLATVKEINKQAKTDVNLTATRTDSGKLTSEAKKAIGGRPVFDLKVNYGNGKQVQSFGTGSVLVTIPYPLGTNEKAENICAVYVDSDGKVQWLADSVYDSVEKVLRFSTDHFSTYGIGYKQKSTAFTDMEGHWAKEDMEFVVSRGLFSGTSPTTFSPNNAMTRGMLVTALGRLANADVSSYKQSSFTDVKGDAYYMGYIEWAKKNDIIKGIGNGKFAPDQIITREQMAVIMSNYAKAMNVKMTLAQGENTFADSVKISTYAKNAVKQMQMAGVMSGKSGNLFDSKGTATRAEASAVLHRFLELATSSNS